MAVGLWDTYFGDPSIYLPFARNTAHGDPFSFNPHEFSSGSTSPLWPFLLAPSFVVGAGPEGAKVIAAVFTLAAVLLVAAAARRASDSLVDAGIATFVLFPVFGSAGAGLYETPLAVGLVALSVVLAGRIVGERPGDGMRLDARSLAPLVAVWAALPLARPEAAVLVPLEAAALWLFCDRRALRPLVLAVAIAALPAIAYFGYSQIDLGSFSTSSEARSNGLREAAHELGPLYYTGDLLDHVTSTPFVFAFVPGLAGLWLLGRFREKRWLAAYAGAGLASYAVVLTFVSPGGFDVGRYLMPAIPFVAVGLAYALRVTHGTRARLPAIALALGLVVAPALVRSVDEVDQQRSVGVAFEETTEDDAARVVNRLAAPDDVVLTHEVQARYQLADRVDVLSLDGVTDGKVFPYLDREDGIAEFLRRYRPRFFIASEARLLSGPSLRDTVLYSAVTRFAADPRLHTLTSDGIRFRLVAQNTRGVARIFGGWSRVFELTYSG